MGMLSAAATSLNLNKEKTQNNQTRNRNDGSAELSRRQSSQIRMLDRHLSAPELPPIGIKPCSPSYSTSPSPRQDFIMHGDSKKITRHRGSPLSPTSTGSSMGGGSSYSNQMSAGMTRSKTQVDLNCSSLTNSSKLDTKLETLYEMSLQKASAGLTLNQVQNNSSPDSNNNDSVSKSKFVTLPPTIDRHKRVQSTNMVSVVHQSEASVKSTTHTTISNKSLKDQSTLSANKLSHENLLRLKKISGRSVTRKQISSPSADDLDYDTDEEKEERIVQWLIGVESSNSDNMAEPPDIQEITTNEKRDTAIHIVYEGD